MNKHFVLLRRRQDLSPAAFLSHWRGEHTQRAVGMPEYWDYTSRYVQNYLHEGGEATPFDGVVELWPTLDRAKRAAFDAAYLRVLRPDEGNFLDVLGCVRVVADAALVVLDGAQTGCKLLSFIRRRPGIGPEQFAEHWRERHAPLILSLPAFAGVTRYVQYRCRPDLQRHFDGTVAGQPFDGVAELYAPSFAALRRGVEDPDAQRQIAADLARFAIVPTLRMVLEPNEQAPAVQLT